MEEYSKNINIDGESTTDFEKALKSLLKLGLTVGGSIWAGNKISNGITDYKRKDDALQDFDNQGLSLWQSARLKDWFRSHDFYVTKFPDTPPEIFPRACKILFDLIIYHTNTRLDKNLGYKILNECEKLHKIAVRKKFDPIDDDWEYWKLVAQKVKKTTFWGAQKEVMEFFKNPSWNLEDFLNDFEGGMIRFGIFGVKEKRIDFCYFKKSWLGGLSERSEVKEEEHTLNLVNRIMSNKKKVVLIYDITFDVIILLAKAIIEYINGDISFEDLKDYRIKYAGKHFNDILLQEIFNNEFAICDKFKKHIQKRESIETHAVPIAQGITLFERISSKDISTPAVVIWDKENPERDIYNPNYDWDEFHRLRITLRDGASCRFCECTGMRDEDTKKKLKLSLHHIFPKNGLKLQPEHKKKLKNVLKEEFENVFGKKSPLEAMRGPNTEWNLVLICERENRLSKQDYDEMLERKGVLPSNSNYKEEMGKIKIEITDHKQCEHHPIEGIFTYQSFPEYHVIPNKGYEDPQYQEECNNGIIYNTLYWYMKWYAHKQLLGDPKFKESKITDANINQWWDANNIELTPNGKIIVSIEGEEISLEEFKR